MGLGEAWSGAVMAGDRAGAVMVVAEPAAMASRGRDLPEGRRRRCYGARMGRAVAGLPRSRACARAECALCSTAAVPALPVRR